MELSFCPFPNQEYSTIFVEFLYWSHSYAQCRWCRFPFSFTLTHLSREAVEFLCKIFDPPHRALPSRGIFNIFRRNFHARGHACQCSLTRMAFALTHLIHLTDSLSTSEIPSNFCAGLFRFPDFILFQRVGTVNVGTDLSDCRFPWHWYLTIPHWGFPNPLNEPRDSDHFC